MKRVTFIEIDFPVCANVFSAAPCTADYGELTYTGTIDDEGAIGDYSTPDDEQTLSSYIEPLDTEGALPGGGECYNTLATCEDVDNYVETTQTARFGFPDAESDASIPHLQSLAGVSLRPQSVSLAENMGVRGIALSDTPGPQGFGYVLCRRPVFQDKEFHPLESGYVLGQAQGEVSLHQGRGDQVYSGR